MGCLAPGPDLLDEPIAEPSADLAFEDMEELGVGDSKFADLPLWYSRLVAPSPSVEPEESAAPEPCSRLFWRATVSRWPIDRRQAWGDRANALQDAGLGWKDAERTAFEEIMSSLQPSRRPSRLPR